MLDFERLGMHSASLVREWSGCTIRRWFDTQDTQEPLDPAGADRIDWLRGLPFALLHLGCVGAIWTGASPTALAVAGALYAVRMFALTGFYHRGFSHRTFRTSRAVQLVFAVIGASSVQRGPLWWAAHHRNHHRRADTLLDPHSPSVHGFLWSHMGWFLTLPRSSIPMAGSCSSGASLSPRSCSFMRP